MSSYEQSTLSNLVLETKDGDWGLDAPADGYIPYHVIRGADFPSVRRGNISTVPIRYLPAQTVERRTLLPGDILIETAGGSRDRPTGRTLYISKRLLTRIGGSVTCASFARFLRIDNRKADPCFIYWYLQNLHTSGAMWEHQVQHTGVARFQYTRFASTHEIPLPPPRRQEAIADLLSALDDKIAVNDSITTTTDELSSALLEGILLSDPEVSNVLLGEISEINRRKVVPTIGGTLRYIDISSVAVGHVDWPALTSWDHAPGRARRGVAPGDTIWSTVRPNRKSFALILDNDPALVVSTGLAVLTPTKVGPAFLYEATKRDAFVQYLESVAEGSAYPAVRVEQFGQASIPLPSPNRLDKFESIAIPLRRRAHAADVESRTLGALRDELLPKLMSGEIRVRDAEKVVEDVT